jgi:glycosyltransferase involved in cell wall biosynthesis
LQIGAREHYAIPRALQRLGLLQHLFTDSWVPPGSAIARFVPSKGLSGRFHPDLRFASIRAPWLGTLPFELCSRLAGSPAGWPRTIARNAWFQHWAARQLDFIKHPALSLFSYSYAARSMFQLARQRGWSCVLGQIDPGPAEEELVAAEHRRYPQIGSSWQPAPPTYWQQWADELALADRIVVNSPWSWRCLQGQGVPTSKLRLIPLVYESPSNLQPRPSAEASPSSGPFHLLFLGTIGLRKGIARLLEAMRILEGWPVQLTLAGPSELDLQAWAGAPNIRWLGPVPRSQVAPLYQQAHAMILPTLSDGFALTQLEALAHGCPVIASQFCGEVVRPGINGWLLPSLEPDAIAATILEAIDTAQALPRPLQRPAFRLAQLAEALIELAPSTISQ